MEDSYAEILVYHGHVIFRIAKLCNVSLRCENIRPLARCLIAPEVNVRFKLLL